MKTSPIIALEFNELCPSHLDTWMAKGLLPNFSMLHSRSDVFITTADVTDPAFLEPWIQWYSVHSGLSYDQHRVFHLTDGAKAGFDDIYRMVLRAGSRVASFASMNVAPFAAPGSVFVSDPWSEADNASPKELNIYSRFVANNVREYSNASSRMGMYDHAKFLHFMIFNGLSASTLIQIISQLSSERLRDRHLSWRRVMLLDRLQYDVFCRYYQRSRPHFASFFANSTAHLQHSYWRYMEPEAFSIQPDAAGIKMYGDAILAGYRAMDGLVGRFLRLARATGARLMLLTALSQQPFLRYEDRGGQHFYRLHDAKRFLADMGIACQDVSPTMAHQYMLRFADASAATAARRRLEDLRMADGRAVFGFAPSDSTPQSLYLGCEIANTISTDAAIIDHKNGTSLRFQDIFYPLDAIKSGRHHPDGCLWIETGRHTTHAEQPSILDILPTQTDLLGIERPAGAFQGRSLVPRLGISD